MTAEAQLQLYPAVAGGQPASESRPEEQVLLQLSDMQNYQSDIVYLALDEQPTISMHGAFG
jgi:hypothetical protein